MYIYLKSFRHKIFGIYFPPEFNSILLLIHRWQLTELSRTHEVDFAEIQKYLGLKLHAMPVTQISYLQT